MEQKHTDYDIHGLVGVRLINPSAFDVATVTKQLGPLQCPLSREPEIIVRFVDQIPAQRLQYVNLHQSGFTEDGFFIFPNGNRKARMAFEQIGSHCEILCEHGVAAVPLLMAIVNLTALKKDCVSLHASAFLWKGTGVLLTGWSKSGKTEALLAFAAQGAQYVGDEWVLLSGDGQRMYGIPENIRLWDWHLDNLPRLRRQMTLRNRIFFAGIHGLDHMLKAIPFDLYSHFPLLPEVMSAFKRKLNVRMAPRAIFGGSLGPFAARPEKLFLMMSQQDSAIEVEPADPLLVAERMVSSIQHEQLPLLAGYLSYRFAFPAMRNDFLENAAELQRDILCRALAGKETYIVRHPYPVPFGNLYAEMLPFVERRDASLESLDANLLQRPA